MARAGEVIPGGALGDTLTLNLGTDVMGNISSASDSLGENPADHSYNQGALYRLTHANSGSGGAVKTCSCYKTGDRLSIVLGGVPASVHDSTAGTQRLARFVARKRGRKTGRYGRCGAPAGLGRAR